MKELEKATCAVMLTELVIDVGFECWNEQSGSALERYL